MKSPPTPAAPPETDLVIVGAPRSGTNMLRDALCRLEGFGTWPCDEINLIWRHGNRTWPDDALPPERADPRTAAYIRAAFARRRRRGGHEVVVEKTCANSLRVPFVDRVLPDARFVCIHRDPVDAVPSAMIRWNAPFELRYTLEKARFVPLSDLPYYGWRFVANRLHRLTSGEGRVASWGPRIEAMDQIVRERSLVEACALQWRECVARSADAFAAMAPARVHVVRYEDFVANPAAGLSAICAFLGRSPDPSEVEAAVAGVTRRSVGKGYDALTEDDRRTVEEIGAPAEAALSRLLESRGASESAEEGPDQSRSGRSQTRD